MDAPKANQSGKRPLSRHSQEGEPTDRHSRPKRHRSGGFRRPPSTKQDETVFRILCPGSKTGSIIGKGGSIIKSIRKDTGAMIRVEEAVPGVDERVVTISAKEARHPSEKQKEEDKEEKEDVSDEDQEQEDEKQQESGESNIGIDEKAKHADISPAQEALFRVHSRIFEGEPPTGEDDHDNESPIKIYTRLLVPTVQVGCLLGKKGKIIEQMRGETGAQIRVLPRDQLPGCASPSDEVVQITGDLAVVKRALLAVSSRLKDNPPKERGIGLGSNYAIGATVVSSMDAFAPKQNIFPSSGNLLGPPVDIGRPISPTGLGIGGGFHQSFGQSSGPFLPDHGPRTAQPFPPMEEEVTFRILIPKEKIGSIIGKGGGIIRSMREETGAKIRIDDINTESDERIVVISANEHPDDNISKAQQAALRVQSRILDSGSDKDSEGKTKLLVPSDQVGCLLGKGGTIIAEMRRLTHARIRVFGKEHLTPFTSKSDELVQVEGDIRVSKEALVQITSRLRNNLFHGKGSSAFVESQFSGMSGPITQGSGVFLPGFGRMPEPVSPGRLYPPVPDVGVRGNGQPPSPGPWPLQAIGGRRFPEHGFNLPQERGRDLTSSTTGFVNSTTVEVVVPERVIGSIIGQGGNNLVQIRQISGAKVKVHDPLPGVFERIVEIAGTPDQTHAAQSLLQAFILSGQ